MADSMFQGGNTQAVGHGTVCRRLCGEYSVSRGQVSNSTLNVNFFIASQLSIVLSVFINDAPRVLCKIMIVFSQSWINIRPTVCG